LFLDLGPDLVSRRSLQSRVQSWLHLETGLNSLGLWVGQQPVSKAGLKSWCPELVPGAGSRAGVQSWSLELGLELVSRAGSRAESEKRLVDGCQNPPTS
jgi:hypothetical protein